MSISNFMDDWAILKQQLEKADKQNCLELQDKKLNFKSLTVSLMSTFTLGIFFKKCYILWSKAFSFRKCGLMKRDMCRIMSFHLYLIARVTRYSDQKVINILAKIAKFVGTVINEKDALSGKRKPFPLSLTEISIKKDLLF